MKGLERLYIYNNCLEDSDSCRNYTYSSEVGILGLHVTLRKAISYAAECRTKPREGKLVA